MSSSPGVPRSTTKARCPARPAARSTVAHTTIQSARMEFEMNVLAPFSTHPSPSRRAAVWMAATSLPAPGSVMPKAAQCGRSRSRNGARKRSFCSGVPMLRSGGPPRPSPGMATDMPRSQYDISSARTTPRRAPLRGPLAGRSSTPSGWPSPIRHASAKKGWSAGTGSRLRSASLRRLCDPNTAPLRASPREVRDLMIAATNGWVVCFDNLDHLPPWLSNALCRLSTGGGFALRRHYTDDEEILFDAMRPILVNGIEELATRGDLLDRAVILHLAPIAEAQRRAEAAFREAFAGAWPALVGSLLDALVAALAVLPSVTLPGLPRMADFARFGAAVERARGWSPGAFLGTYGANRAAAHDLTLEASRVAEPLRDFVRAVGAWTGTASALLDTLTQRVGERLRRTREWPQTPTALGGQLRRLAPTLRTVGVDVLFHREARHRTITLRSVKREASVSSASRASSESRASSAAHREI